MDAVDRPVTGILGAGVMGTGIAQVVLLSGRAVVLYDVDASRPSQAKLEIERRLDRLVEKGTIDPPARSEAMERFRIAADVASLDGCSMVIEAATESLPLKRAIVGTVEAALPSLELLATNTSSLSITEIAAGARRPDRIVGIHFFNPAPVMRLVEIVAGSETAADVVEAAVAFAAALGKESVVASDTPGFIVSRVLDVMVNEAIRCVMDGNRPEDVDHAMRLGANLPIGPLELADLMGLDVLNSVMERLATGFGSDAYAPAPLLVQLVQAGRLGRKTGGGFYDYPPS